ncbi:Hypothetical predicted protein, partial [Cloeon dipterum]
GSRRRIRRPETCPCAERPQIGSPLTARPPARSGSAHLTDRAPEHDEPDMQSLRRGCRGIPFRSLHL